MNPETAQDKNHSEDLRNAKIGLAGIMTLAALSFGISEEALAAKTENSLKQDPKTSECKVPTPAPQWCGLKLGPVPDGFELKFPPGHSGESTRFEPKTSVPDSAKTDK